MGDLTFVSWYQSRWSIHVCSTNRWDICVCQYQCQRRRHCQTDHSWCEQDPPHSACHAAPRQTPSSEAPVCATAGGRSYCLTAPMGLPAPTRRHTNYTLIHADTETSKTVWQMTNFTLLTAPMRLPVPTRWHRRVVLYLPPLANLVPCFPVLHLPPLQFRSSFSPAFFVVLHFNFHIFSVTTVTT